MTARSLGRGHGHPVVEGGGQAVVDLGYFPGGQSESESGLLARESGRECRSERRWMIRVSPFLEPRAQRRRKPVWEHVYISARLDVVSPGQV